MATSITKVNAGSASVVGRAEWLAARKKFLAKEKELTRLRDDLNRQRRELPREKVEKTYVFDGPNGKESLGDLFTGRTQLLVYHFMFGPGWEQGCPSCSMAADSFDGIQEHLNDRDVTFVAISRAPLAEIQAFQRRMGWNFKWVSSHGNDFNREYGVSFTKEQLSDGKVRYNYGTQGFPQEEGPGASAFYKDEGGNVLHTYSTFGRGLDLLLTPYNWLDMAPKGRNEEGLSFPMAWVRHHDRYRTQAAKSSCCEHK